MEERRNGERESQRGMGVTSQVLHATVPAAGSFLGERHCSPANGSSIKLWEGAGGWSILQGGRKEAEREKSSPGSWKDIFEGHGCEVVQGLGVCLG